MSYPPPHSGRRTFNKKVHYETDRTERVKNGNSRVPTGESAVSADLPGELVVRADAAGGGAGLPERGEPGAGGAADVAFGK